MEKINKEFLKRHKIYVKKLNTSNLFKGNLVKSHTFLSTLPFLRLIKITLSINLFIILFILVLHKTLPPQIPLYYGLPEGEEQLAPVFFLTLPSILSIFILGLNIILGTWLKEDFLKKILIASSLPITFFSAITTLKIFFLVGSL